METVLVIGGTGGVGSAVVKTLSGQGMKVYAIYFRDKEKANHMQGSIDNCMMLQCDIRDKDNVRKTIEDILRIESRIGILVNCVTSSLKLKPFENITVEEFYEDMNTILLGSVNVYKSVIPIMKRDKSGTLITLLTSAIFDFPKRMSSYIAAKSSLSGLINTLSAELAPYNIRTLGISPYFIKTDLINAFPEKLLEMEKEKIIEPEDIARLILEAIKDEKRYPSGTNIILHSRKDVLQLFSAG